MFGQLRFAGDAAPRPVLPPVDEAGTDGVVEHVLDRRREVPLVPDHAGGKPFGEEGAEAPMPGVVLSRVVAMEPLHRPRELLRGPLEDRVVVGRHQTPALEHEPEPPDRPAKVDQEQAPVEIVPEERRLGDAPRRDVEVAVGQARPKHASHRAPILSRRRRLPDRSRLFLPTSGTASAAATGVRHPSWLRAPGTRRARPVSDTRHGSAVPR
jgi:hypothetical protein